MRNTSFSPLCAAFLLLMLLSPLAAGAAQPQKPVSSPLTITVQEAEPGQMLLLGSSPEDSDLRVGALICRPLAEQAVDKNRRRPAPGRAAGMAGWLCGGPQRQGGSPLPALATGRAVDFQPAHTTARRLRRGPHVPPDGTLAGSARKAVAAKALPALPHLPTGCRWSSGGTAIRPSRKPAPTVPWSWGTWPPKAMPCWSGATSIPASL